MNELTMTAFLILQNPTVPPNQPEHVTDLHDAAPVPPPPLLVTTISLHPSHAFRAARTSKPAKNAVVVTSSRALVEQVAGTGPIVTSGSISFTLITDSKGI
jgi:hypothetical protein